MTINSMKQNETLLEKKFAFFYSNIFHLFVLFHRVIKLEELHHILKKNVAKLEKTVSQCKYLSFEWGRKSDCFFLGEFVRVDLERMYEHQERSVKSLTDRVDSTIETKLHNCKFNTNFFS
jgi:hypothetical protein